MTRCQGFLNRKGGNEVQVNFHSVSLQVIGLLKDHTVTPLGSRDLSDDAGCSYHN